MPRIKQLKEPEWMPETAPCPYPEDLEFVEMWRMLLGQKKWLKKGLTAIQWNVNRLLKFEVEYAKELVSQAIERGWEGVVFPETKVNYEIWKQKKQRLNGSVAIPKVGREIQFDRP